MKIWGKLFHLLLWLSLHLNLTRGGHGATGPFDIHNQFMLYIVLFSF